MKLRVLVSAYACEPGKGSEPGVGWNQVNQIARFNEVWVITRSNNRRVIEEENLPGNIRWIYYDLPKWTRFWKKKQIGVRLYYLLWQIGIYFVARRLVRKFRFDIIHHVTFVNYWMPSLLSFLPVPFLWGPVGGGDSTPKPFYKSYSLKGRIYENLRGIVCRIGEMNPLVRMTARKANFTLATTTATKKRLLKMGCKKVGIYPESGLSEKELKMLMTVPRKESVPFRIVSIGRLLHLKGFHLSLKAFAIMNEKYPESEYWIIGSGPEFARLKEEAETLGVSSNVKFLGGLSRMEVFAKLKECDILVHPSLHDSGGWVCLEAMASGKPVICLNLGGPAVQVTDKTGIKVEAETVEQVTEDLSRAMLILAGDSALRDRMGTEGRNQVSAYFRWNSKGEWMNNLYERVLREKKKM